MFNFLSMIGNYEERKVARFEKEELTIDTCSVTDGERPYETAVKHPRYNDGDWIVVEAYDTKKAAFAGHKEWVRKMTGKRLPRQIRDCNNAAIARLGKAIGGDEWEDEFSAAEEE